MGLFHRHRMLGVRKALVPPHRRGALPAWSEAECGNGVPGLRFAPSGLRFLFLVESFGATGRLSDTADLAQHGGSISEGGSEP
jgi:hypothetical protein